MAEGNAARNFRKGDYERADGEFYVEPAWTVHALAQAIDFSDDVVWDPCCGSGTIPKVMSGYAKGVLASDIFDRGYPPAVCADFLTAYDPAPFHSRMSIVMNPPFRQAEAFVRHALSLIDRRLAVIQQLSFLASKARHSLFTEFPPSDVLILSRRPSMPPGHRIEEMGDKAFRGGTTDFCWIVWTKSTPARDTRVRWLNPTIGEAA
ncbi:MAG: hypothetical protein DI547_04860 [Sphingobium sp.]|nr:MAG: hypothetical protein DI547_04860 [Sphingobium sp.]